MASLNATTLPLQFKYTPLTTRKRTSTIATAGGVVHQFAAPLYQLDGDSEVAWSVEYATGAETAFFKSVFDLPNPTFLHTFIGNFGENYLVLFRNFEIEKQGFCLFRLTGSFLVVCVVTPANFASTCPC